MNTFLAVTVIGLCTAGAYAIAATGLVLTYTTTGIFNFAHGAIGMLMAFMYWQLAVQDHWPEPLALAAVLLVIAPITGLIIERVLMRPLNRADESTRVVVTMGLLVLLIGVAYIKWPNKSRFVPPLFYGHSVELFKEHVSDHLLFTFVAALVLAGALAVLLYRTRIGVAIRGVVDDPELAAMNGVRPARVSQVSWALSASLAGLAGILLAPQLSLQVVNLTFVVVIAYSAAIVGGLTSLPRTFAGAVILGLGDAYAGQYIDVTKYTWLANFKECIPPLLLFVMVLVLPAARLRVGRAIGRRNPRIPGPSEAFGGALLLAGAALVAAIFVHGAIDLAALNAGMADALIMLSLVVLTGYGGLPSLCQMAFAGIGAVVFFHVSGGGSPLGLIAAAAVCGAVGAIVALPSLRLRGLYLALSTLAFAELADNLFFSNSSVFGGSGSSTSVHRLSIPGLAIKSNQANLVVMAVIFGLFGMAVLAMRRSGFGRSLAAMRDSEAACATLGLDLTATKLAVFSVSAAMAGVAGALYAGTQGIVGGTDFNYVESLVFILGAYVGGINTVAGALFGGIALGAIYPIVQPHIPADYRQLSYVLTGLGAITVGRSASGTVGLISSGFEGWRNRARRRPLPAAERGIVATAVR